MGIKVKGLVTLVLAGALMVLALGAASPAKAAFGIADWEALTCAENADTPEVPGLEGALGPLPFPLPKDPGQCTESTESKWFTQAAGHPDFGITDFTLNTLPNPGAQGFPDGFVQEIVVDTPEGLGVNPEATPVKCTVAQLSEVPAPTCPLASLVGFNYLTVAAQAPPCLLGEAPVPCANLRVKLPVYNLVPFDGVPSMVGFPTSAPGEPTIIVGDLDPSDQHVRFTISDIHAPEGLAHPPIIGSRLVFNGKSTPGVTETYLTMPSNCAGGQTSLLRVKAHGGAEDTASFTTAVGASGCDQVPFNPDLAVAAGGATDSPEPSTIDVQMPDQLKPQEPIANSHLLKATVRLPEGAGLNPAVANGLVPCTDAQFKKGTDDPVECPAASRIGSVAVDTAALDQPLGGDVYIGAPLNNQPTSGNMFRIFIHAFNDRYGVNVRLIGNVIPNLQTGQLTAIVDDNPQAPFNSFRVTIDGGPRGALTSPPTCGPHTVSATYTPWSGTADVTKTDQFNNSTAPGGGACAPTLAARPLDPNFSASPRGTKAGAYVPFDMHVGRPAGDQELKRIAVKLPPGVSAKLAGVTYCPEGQIAAIGARTGEAERANPSCPASSHVGVMGTKAGSGGNPYSIGGQVYLAGPYKGAPLSFVFVTPAVAGPYDLGNVVIRAAANVDPETAVVTVTSDPIPDVFGGVKLDVRSVGISINRDNYTVNPTTCRGVFATNAGIAGGGADPANPAAWPSVARNQAFRATECGALKFQPTFFARIRGNKKQTRRTANPPFQAIYKARKGDANLRRAALILPRSTILDQSHIDTICTRPRLAANDCPRGSIYGQATARSPLLSGNLKGPVYLVPSGRQLPDLLVDLKGQVNIRLRGVISSQNGRLKTVFPEAPDVPVEKFVLNMKGGSQGLLVNTRNLCNRRSFSFLNLLAQNSRRERIKRLPLNTPACNKGRKR